MSTAQELFDALCEPFPTDEIQWRVGPTNARSNNGTATKGQALAYVDARTVMDRLDAACGVDGWQSTYTPGVGGSIVCNIGVRMPNGEWVWKADGAGASDMEAEKGALSDAFKRAAVRFGIGRYLYEMDTPWIELDQGKYIPDNQMKKLAEAHEKHMQKAGWGGRAGVQAYKVLLATVRNFVTQPTDVIEFREKNAGTIALLPAAMRRHLDQELDRVGVVREAAE